MGGSRARLLIAAVLAAPLAACGGGGSTGSSTVPAPTPMPTAVPTLGPNVKIRHVVIIFQENRTVDNLFNGFPGADTVRTGLNSAGQSVPLQPIDLASPYELAHTHAAFLKEFAGGAMNGFDLEDTACSATCSVAPNLRAYGYVPQNEVQPYWTMAQQYAFADRMFQSNQGPSFPAHQYIIGATSRASVDSPLLASSNPPSFGVTAGCDAPPGTMVQLIDPVTGDQSQSIPPCLDHPVLIDLLDQHGVNWRYYHAGIGLFDGPDAIRHIRYGTDYYHVISGNPQIFPDIQNGNLAQVVWVMPSIAYSDHPSGNDGSGPSWVASIVNAIGESPYWSDTAIFVTWDDWGGWYDHVKPPAFNAYENGFRVPLIAISPYARSGYVSHTQHEFGSILKYVETVFNTGSLGYTDARADDLSDMFDYRQAPLPFRHIQSARRAADFIRMKPDPRPPDMDER